MDINRQKVCNSILGASNMIQVTSPSGINYWYNDYKNMNTIIKCLFFADAITMYILCDANTIEELTRICLIASVQCVELKKHKHQSNLMIVIKSTKDMDRIFPTMKKKFFTDRHLEEDYVYYMRQFFGEE